MEPIWTAVFAVGVAQGTLLSLALLWKRTGNPGATRILAALVAVFTLLILGELLEAWLPTGSALLVTVTNINTELAIGPLLWLFVAYVLDPDRRPRRGDGIHFLPLLVALLAWLALFVAWSRGFQVLHGQQLENMVAAFVLFKAAFLYLYLGRSYRRLRRGLADSACFSAERKPVDLNWIKRWFLLMGAAAGFIYLTFFLDYLDVAAIDSDEIGSLILAAIIYLVSLLVIARPWVLSVRPRLPDAERYAADGKRLREYLEQSRAYLEPNLSLADLAGALGSTQNRLSATIHQGLATSFYDLLNGYRLQYFERLARDSALRDRPVLNLAFDSGFNSKASFYRTFARHHRLTPSAYRKKWTE